MRSKENHKELAAIYKKMADQLLELDQKGPAGHYFEMSNHEFDMAKDCPLSDIDVTQTLKNITREHMRAMAERNSSSIESTKSYVCIDEALHTLKLMGVKEIEFRENKENKLITTDQFVPF